MQYVDESSVFTAEMLKDCVRRCVELSNREVTEYYVVPVHPTISRWIRYDWDDSRPRRRKQFYKAWALTYGRKF